MGVNSSTRSLDSFQPASEALGLPHARYRVAPGEAEEMAEVLAAATDARTPTLVWGGGTHQSIGNPVAGDLVVSTARLDRVLAWEPDDLTLVVEAGAKVAVVESMLAERGQTAALPEIVPGATIGGVIAAGISGYRRARYGPTRDRMLEVSLATGDGRMIRAGGRVVKNVTGFDIPRIAAGSFGALGVIVSVCVKLWPLPPASVTVHVGDPEEGSRSAYRPLAVLETEVGSSVFLHGTPAEIDSQTRRLGGEVRPGLDWPPPPEGTHVFSLRTPPVQVAAGVGRLPKGRFVAQHGVGEISFAPDLVEVGELSELRSWAEAIGGALVVTRAPDDFVFDRWGTPPSGGPLRRRLMSAFDPAGILNHGRLPG